MGAVAFLQRLCRVHWARRCFHITLKQLPPATILAFPRVQGPALAGLHIVTYYPIAGTSLTGEPFINPEVTTFTCVRATLGWLAVRDTCHRTARSTISGCTGYISVWVCGVIIMAAMIAWLVMLGVPSPAFCWIVWAILGQASGAYVGPTCWAVLFLSAAAAVLHQRDVVAATRAAPSGGACSTCWARPRTSPRGRATSRRYSD